MAGNVGGAGGGANLNIIEVAVDQVEFQYNVENYSLFARTPGMTTPLHVIHFDTAAALPAGLDFNFNMRNLPANNLTAAHFELAGGAHLADPRLFYRIEISTIDGNNVERALPYVDGNAHPNFAATGNVRTAGNGRIERFHLPPVDRDQQVIRHDGSVLFFVRISLFLLM